MSTSAVTDPCLASATSLARAIRARDLSSVEVVEAHLRRIEATNPSLNAVVQLRAEQALEEARGADAAGEPVGPLHGVPITIKDAFDVAGVVSTGGTRGRAQYVPSQDATAVARLRAAGAVILGKTNLPELSLAYESDNLIYGRTNNPYDLCRTPGGSSGGEGAIVAAGGSALGLGTDAGGSIRVPAHFCGIAGLKPTSGRVPMSGAFPPAMGALGPIWAAGPLARHVEDLGLMVEVLAGPDGRDPYAVPMPLGKAEAVDPRALRVAVFSDNGIASPTPETTEAVSRAARALSDAGARVTEARPAAIERSLALFEGLIGADDGALVQHLLAMVGTSEVHPLLQSLGELCHPFALTTAEFGGLLVQLDVFRAEMLAFMDRFDLLLSPVCAFPAPPHGTTWEADRLPGFSYTQTYNLTGWPAAVVRAGTSPEGLPIGIQLAARAWREDLILAAAQQVEVATGGYQAPQA